MRLVVTGGGTGGHVFPGIAVASALRRLMPDAEILFVGSEQGMEARAVPEAGFAFRAIPARGLLGNRLIRVPAILWTTLRGLLGALRILHAFKPDAVFATGGYVSGPVAVAGRMLGKPLVLHEQNSIPGMTNRWLARIAQEVHLNDPAARVFFAQRGHLKLSGNPIRQEVLQGDPGRARREFDLEVGKTTILVIGGSQGARSINRAAVAAMRSLAEKRQDLQFIIQTGRRDYRWVARSLAGLPSACRVRAFITQMGDVYDLADLVVSRAGAMTLAEIAGCGRAAILVPFPHATHNHQEHNARSVVEVGAASMILDRELNGPRLAAEIAKLIDTPRKLREMSINALRRARPQAAEKIAAALLRFAPADVVVEGNGTAAKKETR
ncbi:MAG: undecaprenyldiphospho-muramoylpentapeptide beta-N-acetylglucosaminyltransferase [Candidatus Eisenbacteria bacterium]